MVREGVLQVIEEVRTVSNERVSAGWWADPSRTVLLSQNVERGRNAHREYVHSSFSECYYRMRKVILDH